jgi:hypothetical protein
VNAESGAETARKTNSLIRELAERFDESLDDRGEYVFFCGCGCMTLLPLTLAVLLADGAWLDGHKPE